MANFATSFLLVNLALAFYLVGAIWALELDIFRNWAVLDLENFRRAQDAHWRRLAYWIFAPLAAALAGSLALVWRHPPHSPAWAIWGNLLCQLLSHALTLALWAPWQSRLSRDPAGAQGVYLRNILRTHWLRTLLINLYGFIMLAWAIAVAG